MTGHWSCVSATLKLLKNVNEYHSFNMGSGNESEIFTVMLDILKKQSNSVHRVSAFKFSKSSVEFQFLATELAITAGACMALAQGDIFYQWETFTQMLANCNLWHDSINTQLQSSESLSFPDWNWFDGQLLWYKVTLLQKRVMRKTLQRKDQPLKGNADTLSVSKLQYTLWIFSL